jgi:hypothetical protein
MVSQKTKKQIGQMQTPGAENAMLKNRVAGCTGGKRSVADKCHFFGVSFVYVTMKIQHVRMALALVYVETCVKDSSIPLAVAQIQP